MQPHSSGRKAQVSSLPKQMGVTEFPQENWVYPNHQWSKKEPLTLFNPKRLPKEILRLVWSESSQNTPNNTISPQTRRFILNPNGPRTDLQP